MFALTRSIELSKYLLANFRQLVLGEARRSGANTGLSSKTEGLSSSPLQRISKWNPAATLAPSNRKLPRSIDSIQGASHAPAPVPNLARRVARATAGPRTLSSTVSTLNHIKNSPSTRKPRDHDAADAPSGSARALSPSGLHASVKWLQRSGK